MDLNMDLHLSSPSSTDILEAREAMRRSAMSFNTSIASNSLTDSASLSRSKTSQADIRMSADALLRASQASPTSATKQTMPPSSRTALASGFYSMSSVSLSQRSSTTQSASCSKPSQTSLQAPPLSSPSPSRTVSASQPVLDPGSSATLVRSLSSVSLASPSVSKSPQAHLGTSAEDMIRASLVRNITSEASHSSLPDSLSRTEKRTLRRSRQSEFPQMSSTMSSISSTPPPYSPPSSTRQVSTADQKSWVRKFQKEADRERARTPSYATNGLFKEAVSVDLLFLIDCTGSMGECIASVKEQVVDIVDDVKRAFLDQAHVRVAVVAYRDHKDSPNGNKCKYLLFQVELLDFTPNANIVKQFVGSLEIGGGRDMPEDVLGGIRQAINASWKQKARCIIHMGDAPPHGRNLHQLGDDEDDYPEPGSEPHSLTFEPLIQRLVALKINFVLLRITRHTDRMAFEFGEIYKKAQAQVKLLQSNHFYEHSKGSGVSGSWESVKSSATATLQFEELELGTSFEALRHLVAASITSSVTRSAANLSKALTQNRHSKVNTKSGRYLTTDQVEEDKGEESFQVPVEKIHPQWDTSGWLDQKLAVLGLCPDMPRHTTNTLRNLMAQDENIKLGFIQLEIQARSKPFSQGAMRTASYARTSASTDRFVIKTSKRKEHKTFASIAEEMKGQALCKAFAIEFNALLDPKYSIDFVVTAALQPQSQASECMSIEPFINGKYVKYNNNSIWVNGDLPNDACNQAAQAFSHFTFERSWGGFLVNDLQGVGNMLTDPAIQTKDPERFKLCIGNLNAEGFKFFFAAHKCNALCRKLQLKSTGQMLIEGRLEFREEWPGVQSRVYCSNKLCRRILRENSSDSDGARKSSQFPGYYWCVSCSPQLTSLMQRRTCAEPDGVAHEFDFSSFFYESQGRAAPLKCPEHVEDDTTEFNVGSVGGGLWARMQAANEKKVVSAR